MMTGKHVQGDEEKEILRSLIDYFAWTIPHLQEVKLNKLMYIAHLYHYAEHGKLLTQTRFFSLGYGPYAPAVRPALQGQLERNIVYLEESRTSPDPVYSNPCLIIKSSRQGQPNLPKVHVDTLEKVVNNWRGKDFEWILDYTTRTFPYLATAYREHIDFRTIEPSSALRQVLPLSRRVWLHRFVKFPENIGVDRFNGGGSGTVSASEVTEIYLALCGNQPDKIPAKENLGFDAAAVLEALHSVESCSPQLGEEPITPIARATQLAYSLVDSMSFKTYSGRVALKSGILFLKKSGYVFNGDVLEKSWPQSYFYNTLKDWFQKINNPVDAENNHISK